MASAIRLTQTGTPDVHTLEQVAHVEPGPNEAWIEQEAIGVNYLDVTQRKGEVPISIPNSLGLEAAGRVTAVGASVTNVVVGDRVAYALGPLGSYASGRLYPAEPLVKLPDAISFDDAAAIVFKGITAQFLIKSTFKVEPGSVVLLNGAAGGVGRILAPWAKHLDATVIGVVSKPASIDLAVSAGCHAALVWGTDDLPGQRVKAAGRKADVVYDGVGRQTFATRRFPIAAKRFDTTEGWRCKRRPAATNDPSAATASRAVISSVCKLSSGPAAVCSKFMAFNGSGMQKCSSKSSPLIQSLDLHR